MFKKDQNGSLKPVILNQLKNHDRVYLKDHYDVDETEKKDIDHGNLDLAVSLGSFKLRTQSNLEFVKSGNKLLPYGNVEHNVTDSYDFNKGSIYEDMAKTLEQNHQALPYTIKSQWKKMPIGVIHTDGHAIDTSDIEWHSIQ